MTSICGETITNNFCSCIGTTDSRYIQYNGDNASSGQAAGMRCCNMTWFTPDILQRLPNMNNPITTVSQFLYYFNELEFVPCNYTTYFGGNIVGTFDADNYISKNYPELFTYADRQRIIYNNFYLYRDNFYPTSVKNDKDLIPVINENTISSPQGTLPLIFNYFDGVRKESQYLFIVWPIGLDFPHIGFSYDLLYFYDINGTNCKTNYCTTLYSPYRGLSFSNTGPGNTSNVGTTTIIMVVVIMLIIFIMGGLLIWDTLKYKKTN